MAPHHSERIRVPDLLGDPAGLRIATVTVARWTQIDATLSPIIGRGGVAALYQRSLQLAALEYPWLALAQGGSPATMDLGALRHVLAGQTRPCSADGGDALLRAFWDLLAGLVGPSLTEQLLGSARQSPLSSLPMWAAFEAEPVTRPARPS